MYSCIQGFQWCYQDHLSPSLCAAFVCVSFMLSLYGEVECCPAALRKQYASLTSRQTELLLPHGSSRSLRIRSHPTSLGHVLLLRQWLWDGLLWLVKPGGVKCGVSPVRVKEGTQRRVKVKWPDREMVTRPTNYRHPPSQPEGPAFGAQPLTVEVATLMVCAWLWSQVLPGDLLCAGICWIRDFYSGVCKTLKLYKHFVLAVWRGYPPLSSGPVKDPQPKYPNTVGVL